MIGSIHQRRRFARWAAAASAALALTFALAACAPDPTIETADASAFREQVVSVAERAQGGDLAGAVAGLERLDVLVTEASAAGRLDAEREQQIREAMTLVRADLDAAIVAATPPEPAPAPAPAPAEGEGNGNGGNGGNGNNGNGNNGNGNGGGDDDDGGGDDGGGGDDD